MLGAKREEKKEEESLAKNTEAEFYIFSVFPVSL